MEVAVAVLGIFHALEGVLVAQAEARVVLLLGELILRITGHDTLQVAVEHTGISIEHIDAVDNVVEAAVALVAPADEFRARLQRLSFAEVEGEVGLPGMTGTPRVRIGVEVAQREPHHVCDMIIYRSHAVVARIVVEEIAQRQRRGVVGVEPPLIVGTGVETHEAVVLVGMVNIAEPGAVGTSRERIPRVDALTRVAAKDAGADVDGAQRVDGVA